VNDKKTVKRPDIGTNQPSYMIEGPEDLNEMYAAVNT
jgi:hypothetical protein